MSEIRIAEGLKDVADAIRDLAEAVTNHGAISIPAWSIEDYVTPIAGTAGTPLHACPDCNKERACNLDLCKCEDKDEDERS